MASLSDERPTASGGADAARDAALRAVVSVPGAACPHCRYSLEGLAGEGAAATKCPECGGGLVAGLVGGAGSPRMKRLMVLMFAWLAFAGCMNATRRGLAVWDWYDMQAPTQRQGVVARGSSVVVMSGRVLAIGGAPTPVPTEWWMELGGWGVLGVLGIGGGVAASLLRTGRVKREKQLLALLVLGFVGYWGYHAFQFVVEIGERL